MTTTFSVIDGAGPYVAHVGDRFSIRVDAYGELEATVSGPATILNQTSSMPRDDQGRVPMGAPMHHDFDFEAKEAGDVVINFAASGVNDGGQPVDPVDPVRVKIAK